MHAERAMCSACERQPDRPPKPTAVRHAAPHAYALQRESDPLGLRAIQRQKTPGLLDEELDVIQNVFVRENSIFDRR